MNIDQVLSNTQLLQRSGATEVNSTEKVHKAKPKLQAMNDEANGRRNYPEQEMTKERANELVEGLNEFLEPADTSIRYEVHDKLERYYISIVDQETDEVVKEIPPEKLLDVYAAMAEFMGFIVDERI
ncbi:flagellar protein FlaG [Alkalibacillus filiformis]|uniref:Flagellar protein FlaG n=1 Tax=Alkalibacillus filiformis TaxID=200990 RepID=A0ABU0DWY8_9BACI|nr:flagellar protein FlaG [Alkalibacillus filiformis]MDQ0352895.1 flagellar protein FlaG [Alkalibacillus filiformis]